MNEKKTRRLFLKKMCTLVALSTGPFFSLKKNKRFNTINFNPATAYGSDSDGSRVKKIGIEEHFYTEGYYSLLTSKTGHKSGLSKTCEAQVMDVGTGRIKELDEYGIDMQVLSLSAPGLDNFNTSDAIDAAKISNDELSEVIKRHPDRFSGFAAIPMQDINAAADELERAVTKLGLKGTMINPNVQGQNLSDKKYEVLFERLAGLDVPIYLHSRGPGPDDLSLHVVIETMNLMNSGLFEKYPGLKIILGHGGESVPFWLWRMDNRWKKSKRSEKSPSEYFKNNFYITTSGQHWPALLEFLIKAVGADRIMFATDYPYESAKDAVKFIDSAPISYEDLNKICHLNAEKLFKI